MKKTILLLLLVTMVALNSLSGTALAASKKEFVPMDSPTTQNLNAVWGLSANDVYAVGEKGTILHYNGTNWTSMISNTIADLNSIWGTSNANIYAVGSNSIGTSTTGYILRYNGTSWSILKTVPNVIFNAVGGSGSYVCAAGSEMPYYYGVVYLKEGSNWTQKYKSPYYGVNSYNDIWGYSYHQMQDFIYIAGENFYYYDSEIILFQPDLIDPVTVEKLFSGFMLHGIWGAAPSEWDIFAVGGKLSSVTTILHYDFSNWDSQIDFTTQLADIWGVSASDVYAVGTRGKIMHYNGTSWSVIKSGTTTYLNGVWGNSSDDFFVVGDSGTILRLNTGPNKPSNNSPANGTGDVSLTLRLKSSAFSDPNSADIHAASQWQIATTSGSYSEPIYNSGTDVNNKISLTVPGGTLAPNIIYYWRVRHQDDKNAWSEWSDETSFTPTLEGSLPKPGLTPDSPFYFLDILEEKVTMFFTFGAENKAKKALEFAEEKLAEIKAMADTNNTKAQEKAQQKYQEYMKLANNKIQEAKNAGRNVEELCQKINPVQIRSVKY